MKKQYKINLKHKIAHLTKNIDGATIQLRLAVNSFAARQTGETIMVKETYYDNLRMIEAATDKILLSKTDVAKILKISRTTVIKKFSRYFVDGYITKAVLARALTK